MRDVRKIAAKNLYGVFVGIYSGKAFESGALHSKGEASTTGEEIDEGRRSTFARLSF
jgi:hypothetical protein